VARLRVSNVLIGLVLGLACGACGPSTPPKQLVSVVSSLGSWQGRDDATLSFNSDSGRFKIKWEARNENPKGLGRLHLVVHSAVSGRPLQDVLDQKGEGSGVIEFSDDPRAYNIMVDSANVDWSVSVEGTSGAYVNRPAPK